MKEKVKKLVGAKGQDVVCVTYSDEILVSFYSNETGSVFISLDLATGEGTASVKLDEIIYTGGVSVGDQIVTMIQNKNSAIISLCHRAEEAGIPAMSLLRLLEGENIFDSAVWTSWLIEANLAIVQT